jgi:MFS family permease
MSADPSAERTAEPSVASRSSGILTRPFTRILGLTLLGFVLEQTLRPVIPLLVIDRGGSTTVVGIVAAAHSLPSVLFRPAIGAAVDRRDDNALLRLGVIGVAVAPIGTLLPGLLALVPARFAQGSAWSLYSVSTQTSMARIAPVHKRGEASGYYQAMPAIASLVAPPIGIALYLSVGIVGPVAFATAVGAAALVLVHLGPRRRPSPAPAATRRSAGGTLIEGSALPSTLLLATFLSAQTLFTVFPPVYATSLGADLSSLALYYPAYGVVLVLGQATVGRLSDRLGRGRSIRIGCTIATVALAIGVLGGSMLTLGIAACLYGLGAALVTPSLSAATMDRAPAERLGSAMATYSIGYQLATGASSLLWGVVIGVSGFAWAFGLAILMQVAAWTASIPWARRDASPSA